MGIFLQDLDAKEVVESNPLELWTSLDIEHHYSLNGIWVISGIPHPSMNLIFRSQLTKNNSFHQIRHTLHFFEEKKLPFSWITSHRSTPEGLGKQLESFGFNHTNAIEGLLLDSAAMATDSNLQEELVVEQVTTLQDLAIWGELYGSAYGISTSDALALAELFYTRGGEGREALRYYIAYLKGTPVATGSLFLQKNIAGIYHIGVIPSERGQGISTALTLRLSQMAQQLNCRYITIAAESRAFAMYHALGFERVCRFHTYQFQFKNTG